MTAWLAQLDPKWAITNAAIFSVLAAVLYGGYYGMIVPTQEQSFQTQKDIVTVQKDIAATLSRQTPILEDIRRNTQK